MTLQTGKKMVSKNRFFFKILVFALLEKIETTSFRAEHFLRIVHRASLEPFHKYVHPQTEAQEYGWLHKPLASCNRLIMDFKLKKACVV